MSPWSCAVVVVVLLVVTGPLSSALGASSSGQAATTNGSWQPLSYPEELEPRDHHTAIWTGTEMIVWGGGSASRPSFVAGARYDPLLDTWALLSTDGVPVGRLGHTAVWTGSRMLVWGGTGPGTCPLMYCGDGASYDPITDTWRPLSGTGAPGPRVWHTAAWTGTEMLIWGGQSASGALGDGARYNPTTDAWRPLSAVGAPSPRWGHTAVWTGSELLIWGGTSDARSGQGRGDGAAYNPVTDTWRPISPTSAPVPRGGHAAIWM